MYIIFHIYNLILGYWNNASFAFQLLHIVFLILVILFIILSYLQYHSKKNYVAKKKKIEI